jgi:Methane oxygenase PmoA
MRPLPLALGTLLALTQAFAADIKVTPNEAVEVVQDGKVVARFMTAHDVSTPAKRLETYKPYLHVFDPSGALRLTKGPGFNFPHHRGIMLGFAKITVDGKTYDRWHMSGGEQVVTAIKPTTDGFVTAIDWQGAGASAKPILTEERAFTFTKPAAPFYFGIEMKSTLKPDHGEAKIDGDPEHAGAQFRPSEKIDGTKTTYIYAGKDVLIHKVKDLTWVAEVFTVEGKTFTALLLNHPTNPKDTAFSAYRDYGRFGAFPKGVATPEAPFKLRYQWLIAEGDVRDAAAFQQAYNAFAGTKEPTPTVTVMLAEQPKPKAPAKK